MSIMTTVKDGGVQLPKADFPDGASVRVELVENGNRRSPRDIEAWMERTIGVGKKGLRTEDVLRETRGED